MSTSIITAVQKLYSMLNRHEKKEWLSMIGFAICVSILEVITATAIVIFAQVLNQPQTGEKYFNKIGINNVDAVHAVLYIAVICGVVYLIKNIIAAIETFHQNFIIQKMNYNLKNTILHRYAQADYSFFIARNSALGSSVVSGDAEMMFSNGLVALATIISESIVFLFLVTMVVAMKPGLALIIFAVGILIWGGMKVLLPKFYRWGQKLQQAGLSSSQHLNQFFQAFKEIILLDKRQAFIEAFKHYSEQKTKIQAIQTATNNIPRMVIEVLFVGLFVVTIAYLCLTQQTPQKMIAILGGYLYVGFRLMPGLNRIITQLNIFKNTVPSIDRVYTEYHTAAAKENYIDCKDFSFEKNILLNNVTFAYPDTIKNALEEFNLSIPKGECLGIVGETGSGKSTLSDILLGLLHPTTGSVLVDNKYPVNSYQWHRLIGYVPQSIYLTDDTVAANIAFGEKPENIDWQRLDYAIKAAQLEKFIANLSQGLETFVGERGVRLSGGERQRVAIARALYRQPEVLIFDEATSALDNQTETKLMETIQMVSQNHTVIMIAHRLTTLKNCDRIVVMAKGKLDNIINYSDLENNKVITYA